ncbi:MAG: flagellar export protein FliJ [Pirellulales bacterium]|nr:flagellar export protein FliJ [Pirellulales bacterium]
MFRFRLAVLRRLREQHRDELRARLAEALEAEQILQQQRAGIDAEAAGLRSTQRAIVQQSKPSVTQLLEAERYALLLQGRRTALADQSRQLAVEIERRRQAVVEADRQVRVLDKLEERQRAEYFLEESRLDGKLMDEIAGQRRGAVDPWA